jgi:hypothetical protein
MAGTISVAPDASQLQQKQEELADVVRKFSAHKIFRCEPPVRIAYCDRTAKFEKLIDLTVPAFLAKFPSDSWRNDVAKFSELLLDLIERGADRLEGLFASEAKEKKERIWVRYLICFVHHMNVWDRRGTIGQPGLPSPNSLGDRAIGATSRLLVALASEVMNGQKGPNPWSRFRTIINDLLRYCQGSSILPFSMFWGSHSQD